MNLLALEASICQFQHRSLQASSSCIFKLTLGRSIVETAAKPVSFPFSCQETMVLQFTTEDIRVHKHCLLFAYCQKQGGRRLLLGSVHINVCESHGKEPQVYVLSDSEDLLSTITVKLLLRETAHLSQQQLGNYQARALSKEAIKSLQRVRSRSYRNKFKLKQSPTLEIKIFEDEMKEVASNSSSSELWSGVTSRDFRKSSNGVQTKQSQSTFYQYTDESELKTKRLDGGKVPPIDERKEREKYTLLIMANEKLGKAQQKLIKEVEMQKQSFLQEKKALQRSIQQLRGEVKQLKSMQDTLDLQIDALKKENEKLGRAKQQVQEKCRQGEDKLAASFALIKSYQIKEATQKKPETCQQMDLESFLIQYLANKREKVAPFVVLLPEQEQSEAPRSILNLSSTSSSKMDDSQIRRSLSKQASLSRFAPKLSSNSGKPRMKSLQIEKGIGKAKEDTSAKIILKTILVRQ